MKIIVRPIRDPQREIDLTQGLVAAIAEELWRICGGNDQLNWIEAEWHLQRIVGQVRTEARHTGAAVAEPSSDQATSRTPRAGRNARGETASPRAVPRTRERPRSKGQKSAFDNAAHWNADALQIRGAAMANAW